MLRMLGKIPLNIYIAVSGGPDSMAVLDFCRRGRKSITVLTFNHGTEFGAKAESVVLEYCKEHCIDVYRGEKQREKMAGESPEEYWRNMRYDFFRNFSDQKIVMCHNLDDQIEQWIMTSLHGNPRLIPYANGNIIRPFMISPKTDFVDWCDRKSVPYMHDPGNFDSKYQRSFVRNEVVPLAMMVNPGLYKTIGKKVRQEFKDNYDESRY